MPVIDRIEVTFYQLLFRIRVLPENNQAACLLSHRIAKYFENIAGTDVKYNNGLYDSFK